MIEQWVLLWSKAQNALHVETVERMLESNRRAYRDNLPSDYIALFIGPRELVDATADNVRPTLVRRDADRGSPVEPYRVGAA